MAETGVMVGFFVIVMVIFYWGWVDYKKMREVPPNALEINVSGRQWDWDFEYTNGRKMTKEVVVPKGRPVKLILASKEQVIRFRILRLRGSQGAEFTWGDARFQSLGNFLCHLAFNPEDILQFAVITIRPSLSLVASVDQLDIDADIVA